MHNWELKEKLPIFLLHLSPPLSLYITPMHTALVIFPLSHYFLSIDKVIKVFF